MIKNSFFLVFIVLCLKDPRFHLSIAWTLGDVHSEIDVSTMESLQVTDALFKTFIGNSRLP